MAFKAGCMQVTVQSFAQQLLAEEMLPRITAFIASTVTKVV